MAATVLAARYIVNPISTLDFKWDLFEFFYEREIASLIEKFG